MARPACLTSRTQRHSASTIAIFIKTSSVGGTHSIGIEWQCSVGQMRRSGASPSVLSITWISRPVKISPQTRQYRFSSRECHWRNRSSRRKTFSFSSSDNLIEERSVIAKASFRIKCPTIGPTSDWCIGQNPSWLLCPKIACEDTGKSPLGVSMVRFKAAPSL
jgi:hypothetical protein